MTSPKEETYEFDSQLSSARQTGLSGRSVMATCNQSVLLFTVNEHDGSGNDWPAQSPVCFAWTDAPKPKTTRGSLKLNIKTAGWWMVRIILGVFLNSRHWHAIFHQREGGGGHTIHQAAHSLLGLPVGSFFFFQQGWIVKSMYPLSWELLCRLPDLAQHYGSAGLRCVGGDAALQFNFCI